MHGSLLQHPVFRSVVLPVAIGVAGLGALIAVAPRGVATDFAAGAALAGAAIAALAMLAMPFSARSFSRFGRDPDVSLRASDLLLVLLPLAPIVQYTVLNREILVTSEALALIATCVGLFAGLIVVVPWLLARITSRPVLVGVAVGMCCVFANMAALSQAFNWHRYGDGSIQGAVLAGIVWLTAGLYAVHYRALLVVACAVFAGTVIPAVLADDEPAQPIADARVHAFVAEAPVRTPNVYLMTYDSYVQNETMQRYGIDNSAQEAWLEAHGFEIYRDVYSVAASSIASMGRVLAGRADIRSGVAGRSPALDVLRSAGYRIAGVFPSSYFFETEGSHYDYSFPPRGSSAVKLGMAILEGEFRHDAAFADVTHDEFLDEKRRALRDTGGPTFLYTHTGPGHSQNSGACTADETARFATRLAAANREMRDDVNTLLEYHGDAIVVINGDHGPYLTGNCYRLTEPEYPRAMVGRAELQDRYGAFLAIRWPEPSKAQPDIAILQDALPAVLRHLYPHADFEHLRTVRQTVASVSVTSGVDVIDGVVRGGRDDGERLFEHPVLEQIERAPRFADRLPIQ